jgi:hypothetical protein
MTMPRHVLPCTPALMLLACSLSACSTPTAVDRDFGLAVQKAQRAQTQTTLMNPPASTGMDAGTVRSSIVRYEKSFVTPPSPVTSLDQSLGSASSMPR